MVSATFFVVVVLCVLAQCSNESVFGADFHPTDCNIMVTCGKSHLYFWNLEKGVLVKKQGLFEVGQQTASHMLDQYHEAIKLDIEAQIQSWQPVLRYKPLYRDNHCRAGKNETICVCVLCFIQKQEKPKFVLCVTFAENGDAITGDSSGNILVWGKGMLIHFFSLCAFQRKKLTLTDSPVKGQ